MLRFWASAVFFNEALQRQHSWSTTFLPAHLVLLQMSEGPLTVEVDTENQEHMYWQIYWDSQIFFSQCFSEEMKQIRREGGYVVFGMVFSSGVFYSQLWLICFAARVLTSIWFWVVRGEDLSKGVQADPSNSTGSLVVVQHLLLGCHQYSLGNSWAKVIVRSFSFFTLNITFRGRKMNGNT